MITHGKLSSHVHLNSAAHVRRSKPFSITLRPDCSSHLPTSLRPRALSVLQVSRLVRTRMSRLRNFDTEPHSSYYHEVEPDNLLESVANAHTAADLHVRPVPLTALVSRAVDAANALRDIACLISRNENDSTRAPVETASPLQNQRTHSGSSSKVLNLCIDSRRAGTVTFLTCEPNNFINQSSANMAKSSFRTTLRHYADK
jgi:hypothetical protein